MKCSQISLDLHSREINQLTIQKIEILHLCLALIFVFLFATPGNNCFSNNYKIPSLSTLLADTVAPLPKVSHFRNKPTSVSTKSLPPLIPGAKPTKPFDYKGAKSLDLTLGKFRREFISAATNILLIF